MNSKQRKLLVTGAIFVVLMLLFPPWDYFDSDSSARRSAGYHFFLTPPGSKSVREIFGPPRYPHMTRVRVNDLLLILQLLVTIPVFLGLAVLMRSTRSAISIGLGIVFIGFGMLVFAFITWSAFDARRMYGRWQLP